MYTSVAKCTGNELLELEATKFCKRMQGDKVTSPKSSTSLTFNFQGQRFESSSLASSHVIISKTVTDRTNIAIAKTGSHLRRFDRHIYI